MRAAVVLPSLVFFAGLAGDLAAQSPRGGVVVVGVADAATGAPVIDADVRLTSIGRSARTDWLGRAHFSGVRRGGHHISVRALGYAPLGAVVEVRDGARDTLEAVLFLDRPGAVLDTVNVVARAGRRRPALLREFDARRRIGYGQYLTAQEIDGEWTRPLADVVAVRFAGLRSTADSTGRTRLYSTRSTGLLSDRFPNRCPIDVYYNGVYARDGDIDLPSPIDVAALEYYGKSAAPPQYRRVGKACGVLLVWLK